MLTQRTFVGYFSPSPADLINIEQNIKEEISKQLTLFCEVTFHFDKNYIQVVVHSEEDFQKLLSIKFKFGNEEISCYKNTSEIPGKINKNKGKLQYPLFTNKAKKWAIKYWKSLNPSLKLTASDIENNENDTSVYVPEEVLPLTPLVYLRVGSQTKEPFPLKEYNTEIDTLVTTIKGSIYVFTFNNLKLLPTFNAIRAKIATKSVDPSETIFTQVTIDAPILSRVVQQWACCKVWNFTNQTAKKIKFTHEPKTNQTKVSYPTLVGEKSTNHLAPIYYRVVNGSLSTKVASPYCTATSYVYPFTKKKLFIYATSQPLLEALVQTIKALIEEKQQSSDTTPVDPLRSPQSNTVPFSQSSHPPEEEDVVLRSDPDVDKVEIRYSCPIFSKKAQQWAIQNHWSSVITADILSQYTFSPKGEKVIIKGPRANELLQLPKIVYESIKDPQDNYFYPILPENFQSFENQVFIEKTQGVLFILSGSIELAKYIKEYIINTPVPANEQKHFDVPLLSKTVKDWVINNYWKDFISEYKTTLVIKPIPNSLKCIVYGKHAANLPDLSFDFIELEPYQCKFDVLPYKKEKIFVDNFQKKLIIYASNPSVVGVLKTNLLSKLDSIPRVTPSPSPSSLSRGAPLTSPSPSFTPSPSSFSPVSLPAPSPAPSSSSFSLVRSPSPSPAPAPSPSPSPAPSPLPSKNTIEKFYSYPIFTKASKKWMQGYWTRINSQFSSVKIVIIPSKGVSVTCSEQFHEFFRLNPLLSHTIVVPKKAQCIVSQVNKLITEDHEYAYFVLGTLYLLSFDSNQLQKLKVSAQKLIDGALEPKPPVRKSVSIELPIPLHSHAVQTWILTKYTHWASVTSRFANEITFSKLPSSSTDGVKITAPSNVKLDSLKTVPLRFYILPLDSNPYFANLQQSIANLINDHQFVDILSPTQLLLIAPSDQELANLNASLRSLLTPPSYHPSFPTSAYPPSPSPSPAPSPFPAPSYPYSAPPSYPTTSFAPFPSGGYPSTYTAFPSYPAPFASTTPYTQTSAPSAPYSFAYPPTSNPSIPPFSNPSGGNPYPTPHSYPNSNPNPNPPSFN